ncbi:MAG: hypothetical protein HZC02_01155 [Candidatus Levybacteria bacterium]|nr:hypothetical protein [Candidatus Levybacteria bacterium]
MFLLQKDREAQKTNGTTSAKRGKRVIIFALDKRQKFVVGMLLLSVALFASEFQFGKSGIGIATVLAIATDLLLFWAIKDDLEDNFSIGIFLLPFFYSLSFALFYFLIPTRLLFRLLLTGLYAFGLYSLFLSENIFTVSGIRTIALLSGARIVSFVLTLLSYFFLTNIVFSLHAGMYISIPLLALYTFPLVYQSLWSYNLQKNIFPTKFWAGIVTLCIIQVASIVWFWPSTPTVIGLFLAGFFYTLTGICHVWIEKKLFKNVIWEYVWVGAIVLFLLLLFTAWGK